MASRSSEESEGTLRTSNLTPLALRAYKAKVTSEYSSLTNGPITPDVFSGKILPLVAELPK